MNLRRLAVGGVCLIGVAAVVCAGLLAALVALRLSDEQESRVRRALMADHYAEVLAQSLWRYDLAGVRGELNGLILNGDLRGVRVDGDGGQVAIQVGAADDPAPLRRALGVARDGGQTIIGVVTFYFDDAEALRRRLALAAGLGGALTAGALIGFLAEAARRRWHAAPIKALRQALAAAGLPPLLAEDWRELAATLAGLAEETAQARAAATAARRDAESAANVKSAFLANVSHELRTPLNGVIGLLTLLAEQPLSPQQRGYIQSALLSAENLLGLVTDLLDMTQLEAGKMPVRVEAVDLKALLADVAAAVAPRAAQRENLLRWEVLGETPAYVLADGEKLRRILLNLTANAVKFTKGGKIVLRAFIAGTANDGALLLRLEVEDNGVGVSPDQKERLFQRFYQVDQSATRNHDGSGLGLAICRALCQLMRGRIGVDSAPGVGSLFWVEAPVVPAADRAGASPPPVLRVLVVDDIALNRALLSEILKTHGCTPLEAADAAAALDLLENGDVCDAVLMDIEMPLMDGCEATRRIRALPAPAGALPVVAMTANVDADARRRFAECGIDDWAAKPACWPDIAAALLRARDAARRRASGGVP